MARPFFCRPRRLRYHTLVKRLIIADSHVGQGHDDVRAMTALLERAAAEDVGEVIYLGDAFQYLIGMTKFWTTSVFEVRDVWRRLRAAGITVGIVEGNRDFFLDARDLADEVDWSARKFSFKSGGKTYLLDHGDHVNPRDFQYRFWSTVSKSQVARLWAHLLPRPIAVGIVRYMEAHLAKTNRKFRYTRPIADLRRYAEVAWGRGVDIVFWGHFHTPWRCRNGSGNEALIVPAWLENRTSILVEPDGRWDLVDDSLKSTDLKLDELSEPERNMVQENLG